MPGLLEMCVAGLATWRISASLYYGKEFEQLRYRLTAMEPVGFWGRQIVCFWCVSFWVAWPVAVVAWLWWPALVPFALSGAVVLLSGGGRTIWREAIQ